MDGWEAQGRANAGTPVEHAGGHPAPIWAGSPETRYAKSEDGYVAYQVFGRGPHDLLLIGNWASNVEVMWEHPSMARYLDRLGQFARVICFDKRGAGLSDPVALGALPTVVRGRRGEQAQGAAALQRLLDEAVRRGGDRDRGATQLRARIGWMSR